MNDAAMNAFLRLMQDAFNYAKRAHACSFSDSDKNRVEDKCSALSYAAACTAKYSAAEAIYWTTPELEHPEIPDLFTAFSSFVHEVQTDYETNHSRQWVDIRFNDLEKAFKNSVCNQRIR